MVITVITVMGMGNDPISGDNRYHQTIYRQVTEPTDSLPPSARMYDGELGKFRAAKHRLRSAVHGA